jgi:hypothetical protein
MVIPSSDKTEFLENQEDIEGITISPHGFLGILFYQMKVLPYVLLVFISPHVFLGILFYQMKVLP